MDVCQYESMMVLREDTAFFTMTCPHCLAKVSSVNAIPLQLREEIRSLAIEIGAGMGRDS